MAATGSDKDLEYIVDAPKLMHLLEDIFTDAFMQAHTNFENFKVFQYSSAVIVNWNAENLVYSKNLLNHFVQESTEYDGWEALVHAAVAERYHRPNSGDARENVI